MSPEGWEAIKEIATVAGLTLMFIVAIRRIS